VGAGAVWVTESLTGKVAEIDTSSGKVNEIPLLHGDPLTVIYGDGYVWVTAPADDSLTRIDPGTGQTNTVSDVGDGPSGLAVRDGVVHVANAGDGTVVRVSVKATKILGRTQLPSGLSPNAVAVTDGAVWIAIDAS
jgi:streptogramin lyase